MGAGASVPSSVEEAVAFGYTPAQIDAYFEGSLPSDDANENVDRGTRDSPSHSPSHSFVLSQPRLPPMEQHEQAQSRLVVMGFSPNACALALIETESKANSGGRDHSDEVVINAKVDAALHWLLAHPEAGDENKQAKESKGWTSDTYFLGSGLFII